MFARDPAGPSYLVIGGGGEETNERRYWEKGLKQPQLFTAAKNIDGSQV